MEYKPKDNFEKRIDEMWKNIRTLIENYYPSNINQIPKLEFLGKQYNLNRKTLRKYILVNLIKEKNPETAKKIYSDIWHKELQKTNDRQSKFLTLMDFLFIDEQLTHSDSIMGINSIQKEIAASKPTIINWVKSYLNDRFGKEQSILIYERIWGSKCRLKKKYTYDLIKEFISDQNGYIITSRDEWELMEDIPSERYIKIGHPSKDIDHIWIVKVRYLINQSRWCPECNEYFCQKILQLYLNKIFGVNFRPITFKHIFGLGSGQGGRLKYDLYNENVVIENIRFKVAAEYDGEQHDLFPNAYHKMIEDFYTQKRNDRLKDIISTDKSVILIRIKAIYGFHRNNIFFQNEIIKQINSNPILKKVGVKLENIPKYVYNPFLKRLEEQKSLKKFLSSY